MQFWLAQQNCKKFIRQRNRHRDIQEGLDRLNRLLEKRDDKGGITVEISKNRSVIITIPSIVWDSYQETFSGSNPGRTGLSNEMEGVELQKKGCFHPVRVQTVPSGCSQPKKYEHLKKYKELRVS